MQSVAAPATGVVEGCRGLSGVVGSCRELSGVVGRYIAVTAVEASMQSGRAFRCFFSCDVGQAGITGKIDNRQSACPLCRFQVGNGSDSSKMGPESPLSEKCRIIHSNKVEPQNSSLHCRSTAGASSCVPTYLPLKYSEHPTFSFFLILLLLESRYEHSAN